MIEITKISLSEKEEYREDTLLEIKSKEEYIMFNVIVNNM